MSGDQRPYPFHAETLAVLAWYAATSPRAHSTLLHAIDPERLGSAPARVVLRVARRIHEDTGAWPQSALAVLQAATLFADSGKLSDAALAAIETLLEDGCIAAPPLDDFIAATAPTVRAIAAEDAVAAAISAQKDPDSLRVVAERMAAATRIGKVDRNPGIGFDAMALHASAQQTRVETLAMGVESLDTAFDGGLPRGCLGFVAADSGGGKSMFLANLTAFALVRGLRVAYATLELSEAKTFMRIFGNVCNIPVRSLLRNDKRALAVADRRLAALEGFGALRVRKFEENSTTVADITAWVNDVESDWGAKADLLVVDYADLLLHTDTLASGYTAMRSIYLGLREWAAKLDRWCWTATQTTRAPKGGRASITINDMADSQNKIRVADVAVAINQQRGESGDDAKSVVYVPLKFRDGDLGAPSQAELTFWQFGRMTAAAPLDWSMDDVDDAERAERAAAEADDIASDVVVH